MGLIFIGTTLWHSETPTCLAGLLWLWKPQVGSLMMWLAENRDKILSMSEEEKWREKDAAECQ